MGRLKVEIPLGLEDAYRLFDFWCPWEMMEGIVQDDVGQVRI